jgi:protein SCO1/2
MFGLAAGLAVLGLMWQVLFTHTFSGTQMQSPQLAYDFSLSAPENKIVHLSDMRGKVVLLYFGYISCPDECPATTAILERVLDQMSSQAERVQVILVTVDPERDTPENLRAYLNTFGGRILGLSGDLKSISETASKYGVFFQKKAVGDQPYTVEHTLLLELIDPEGFARVVYTNPTAPEGIVSDLKYILGN